MSHPNRFFRAALADFCLATLAFAADNRTLIWSDEFKKT